MLRGHRIDACRLGTMWLVWLSIGAGRTGLAADAAPPGTDAPPARCQSAYQDGLQNAEAGHLVEASRLFASCADLACGAEIWPACVEENRDLNQALPSIIPFMVDDDGTPVPDVTVQIDGRAIARELAGVAIFVDPGPHRVTFVIRSRVVASESVVVEEGERSRPLSLRDPTQTNRNPDESSALEPELRHGVTIDPVVVVEGGVGDGTSVRHRVVVEHGVVVDQVRLVER